MAVELVRRCCWLDGNGARRRSIRSLWSVTLPLSRQEHACAGDPHDADDATAGADHPDLHNLHRSRAYRHPVWPDAWQLRVLAAGGDLDDEVDLRLDPRRHRGGGTRGRRLVALHSVASDAANRAARSSGHRHLYVPERLGRVHVRADYRVLRREM